MTKKTLLAIAASCLVLGNVSAEIIPLSPVKDAMVELLPENQRALTMLSSHGERLSVLQADMISSNKRFFREDAIWRAAVPVRFYFKCTEAEFGFFSVEVSENPDFSKSSIAYFEVLAGKGKELYEVPMSISLISFKVGTRYYWRVRLYKSRDTSNQEPFISKTETFVTSDMPPRWVALKGRVGNIRDLGGWKAMDGKRVKQGMIFRGQAFNDNSIDGGLHPGRNRLSVEDCNYLTNTICLKTDLDIRSDMEIGGMTKSPVGESLQFIHSPSKEYAGLFDEKGKEIMARNFRIFCDPNNYPIYMHCIAGADRTGSLAYTLLGVLGVSENNLAMDWGHTYFPKCDILNGKEYYARLHRLTDCFQKYGSPTDSMQTKVTNYLHDCGITDAEIETFRKIMLE